MKVINFFLALTTTFALSSANARQISSVITETNVRLFCEAWLPALVRGDRVTDAAAQTLVQTFYTPTIILIDPNFAEPQVGSEALFNYYRVVLGKYPHWSFQIEKIYLTEDGFILHYIGKVPGEVEFFRGVDIIDLDPQSLEREPAHWKIAKLIGIYDRTPFQRTASAEELP